VTAGDALVPEAVQAIDAATIDAFVGRRRSELARLSLAARTATQRRERADAALAAVPEVGADGIPSDLLTVVDAMLESAAHASEIGLEAAWSEAAVIVATAWREGAETLRRVGLDPAVLPVSTRPAEAVPRVVAPPSAAELWRDVRPAPVAPAPAPTSVGPAPTTGPPSGDGRAPEPSAWFGVSAAAPVPATPAVPVDETVVGVPAVSTLLLDSSLPEPDQDGSAEVYDIFWQEVSGERRVRDRLLRRSPKEGA
jgi:hypothetical protein